MTTIDGARVTIPSDARGKVDRPKTIGRDRGDAQCYQAARDRTIRIGQHQLILHCVRDSGRIDSEGAGIDAGDAAVVR